MTSAEGDNIIELFDNWFKHYTEVTNHLAEMEENFKRASVHIETLTKTNARLQSDCSILQETVGSYQQQLHTVCDLEDEVQNLKQKIAEKEQDLLNKATESTATIDRIKQAHEYEMESSLASVKAEYDTKITDLESQLKMETEVERSLQSQLEDLKRDKDKEISRITMEYESKLVKAHRQKAQYIQQQQQILNQDVMRKKMQHMKENYEGEIAALKSQIQDLKHMLESVHQRRPGKDNEDNAFGEQPQPKLQPQKLYLQDRQSPRQRGQLSLRAQRNVSKYRSGSSIKL
ncbi:unnamed protein product [Candidula unifasciata]|uniref:Uncharacterized protein n=1 Tax=Candidula unifasciata TaxID=100452 RepID=A0A8S3ZI49_9EUPU|nr:unnamed protein product [Candidula unifasciata]